MAIVVDIHNAGTLVDREVGIDGVAEVAGELGLGGALARKVDAAAADKIREALAAEGVLADVYTTADPPPPDGGGGGGLVKLLLVGLAFYFIVVR